MSDKTSRHLLPVEIYEAIISLVTSTKDLFNLSLTCRQLCGLIIPNHIDYRAVVCSSSDSLVWEHFLNNPHLAKGIDSIKILDDIKFQNGTGTDAKRKRRVIPRELQMLSTQELKSVSHLEAFTESILVMKDLYSFDYRGPCPAFLLFTHLAHCATGLRIFKYDCVRTSRDRAFRWEDLVDSASQVNKGFEYLECCSLNIRFWDKYDNEANVLSMINNLLENNRFLKSVTLSVWDTHFESIPISKFLLDANWPKITTLALGGEFAIFEENINLRLRISPTQNFFSRHASLEKLRIRDSANDLICPGTIEPNMLPKLRTLDLDFHMPFFIYQLIPENVVNRLVNFSVSLSYVPDSFITSGCLKNIRRLYTGITSYDRLPLLLEAIPNIERLRVESSTRAVIMIPEASRDHILFLKEHSKNLSHLFLSFSRSVRSRIETSIPDKYAQELDRLEFIYFFRATTTPWFRVIRSPSGTISLERHFEKSDEWAVHLWMGFDSPPR